MTVSLRNRIERIEAATKDFIPQMEVTIEEVKPFAQWCFEREDRDALWWLRFGGNRELADFYSHESNELSELFDSSHAMLLRIGTDEEFLAEADERETELFFLYKAEVDEWRRLCRIPYKPLEEQLKSADKEIRALARHYNKQLAEFRANTKSTCR